MKTEMSEEQHQRLERLAAMAEDDIDTTDIPEVLDWSNATRGAPARLRSGEHVEPTTVGDTTVGTAVAKPAARDKFWGRNLVPDEATALLVGTAILRAYLGAERFTSFQPYRAMLRDGWWTVMGDSPAHKAARLEQERLGAGHLVSVRGGGGPCLVMSLQDARVESISFMR